MRVILTILLSVSSCHAATWYASTNGTAGGSGSVDSPWNLVTALGSPSIRPGDTLYLRGGDYQTAAHTYSTLNGSESSQVTVCSYPGEWAVIDCTDNSKTAIYLNGSYTTWKNVEIKNSDPDRWTSARGAGFFVNGPGSKVINCLIHDTGQGIYAYEGATNFEFGANLIYYSGAYYSGGGGKYHGIYAHSGATNCIIRDNLICRGYGFGIHGFSDNGGPTVGYDVIGNIVFESGSLNTNTDYARLPNFLIGSVTTANNVYIHQLLFRNNYGYSSDGFRVNGQIGYYTAVEDYENAVAVITNNYFGGGFMEVGRWTNLTFRANTVCGWPTTFRYHASGGVESVDWDANTYFSLQNAAFNYITPTLTTNWSFSQWTANLGYDENSTITTATNFPQENLVVVRPNQYGGTRHFVAVFNWLGQDNVTADLSSALSSGDTYTIKVAENYFGPTVLSGTYAGAISLPMTNLVCSTPVGASTPSSTGPQFAAFVVTKTGQSTAPSTATTVNAGTLHLR